MIHVIDKNGDIIFKKEKGCYNPDQIIKIEDKRLRVVSIVTYQKTGITEVYTEKA